MDDHRIDQGNCELFEDDLQPHRTASRNRDAVRRRALVLGLAAGAMVVGLAAAGTPSAHAESTLERIKAQGYLRMGFANENPFSYATPEGELAGVDVEILKHILADMGIPEIDGGVTTFGGLRRA